MKYDPVDAAYLFAGFIKLREQQRRIEPSFTLQRAGDLEDMAFMWMHAKAGAEAIAVKVHPAEFDRLAVFAYECLDASSPLVSLLFNNPDRKAADMVAQWCATESILTTEA